jgi:hypothetical protein
MISQYAGFDSSLQEDKQQSNSSPGMRDTTKHFAKDKLADIQDTATGIRDSALANLKSAPGNVADLAKKRANSLIDGAVLGNVFGLRNQIIGTLQNPQGLINAALGAAVQASGLSGSDSGNIKSQLGDGVFEPSTNGPSKLKTINAFGAPGPSQDNGGLASSNIFK